MNEVHPSLQNSPNRMKRDLHKSSRRKYTHTCAGLWYCTLLQCRTDCCGVTIEWRGTYTRDLHAKTYSYWPLFATALCCRVEQIVAGCCSALPCVAVRCRVLQCVAASCCVLQSERFVASASSRTFLQSEFFKSQCTSNFSIQNNSRFDFREFGCKNR